jgi:hypothetical protein
LEPDIFIFYKKLPPFTLTGFDLATHELQSPKWQAETIPLDQAAKASIFYFFLFMFLFYFKEKNFTFFSSSDYRSCEGNDHRCGNGLCVPASKRCDHYYDCRDESDEAGCTGVACMLQVKALA